MEHFDVPNAYVKADKEEDLEIYLQIPQGLKLGDAELEKMGAKSKADLALQKK